MMSAHDIAHDDHAAYDAETIDALATSQAVTDAAAADPDVRSAFAMVIRSALWAEGWKSISPVTCYAVADALLIRPGMLRAGIAYRPSDRRTEPPTATSP